MVSAILIAIAVIATQNLTLHQEKKRQEQQKIEQAQKENIKGGRLAVAE